MSIYQRRASLKKFIQYIDQVYHTNHACEVPKVARPSQRTLIAQDDELKRILGHLPMWMRVFTLLCRMMGLRHGEALDMTPAHYNPTDKTLSFKRKMGGTSNIPVPVELQTAIEYARTINPHAPILESLGMRANKNPREAIWRFWKQAKKKAKANPDLHIHDLRRTIATDLYSATKDLRAVQTLLGHKSLNSTILYIAPMDPGHLRSLMDDLHPSYNLADLKPATETKQ